MRTKFAIEFSENEGEGVEGHLEFFRKFIRIGSVTLPLACVTIWCKVMHCCQFLGWVANARLGGQKGGRF